MKNYFRFLVLGFFLLSILSCVTTTGIHNSRNSLDWDGIYTGIIPGADSMGINVRIILNKDETYIVNYQYIGRSDQVFTYTGTFKWDERGNTITLDSDVIPPHYRVGENTLTQLDMRGRLIRGELADHYVLRKQ